MLKIRSTTGRDLRRSNRSLVFSEVFFNAPISRFELVRETELSAGTVSNVVADLIDAGLVAEAGSESAQAGRPRVLLEVNAAHACIVGVAIGAHRIAVGLFDLRLHERESSVLVTQTEAMSPEFVVDAIVSEIEQLCARNSVRITDLFGVGVGVSGQVTRDTEVLVTSRPLGWNGVPLRRLLSDRLHVEVFVDNGAKNMGQAESWFGAGQGIDDAFVAMMSSGVGAALILNGSSYAGPTVSAGEWGHTTIVVGGRVCPCGARGCLEAYIGADAILERYREAGGDVELDENQAISALVLAAATEGPARDVVLETIDFLGAGLGNVVNLLSPSCLVIGGWVGLALSRAWLPEIIAATQRHSLEAPFARTTIVAGRLGPESAVIGAATLPLEEILQVGV